MSMIEFREYQIEAAAKLTRLVAEFGFGYLCGECRTGKTITVLKVIGDLAKENVLFVTKKKAIPSIEKDVKAMGLKEVVTVTNFEQVKKFVGQTWDCVVVDEAHSIGAFPKASQRQQQILNLVCKNVILMSGTPSPESFSQLYHQYACTKHLWSQYQNFYRWADNYVNVKKKKVGTGIEVNDYSEVIEDKVLKAIKPYVVEMTQRDAGFEVEIVEQVHLVKMKKKTYRMILRIIRDGVIGSPRCRSVLADSGSKVMSKLRQLSNGHVITENHGAVIFDYTKIEYIKKTFKNRLAILYCFKAEGVMLKKVFGDCATDNPEIFNEDDSKVFIGQVRSSREGVNLSAADDLVFVGIDYSALSYLQSRERLSFLGRKNPPKIHYVFAEKTLETKVFKTVQNKENFTVKHYRHERTGLSIEVNQGIREERLDSNQDYYEQQNWLT